MEWNVSEAERASLESEFNIRLIDTKDIYLSLARLEYNLVLMECYFVPYNTRWNGLSAASYSE